MPFEPTQELFDNLMKRISTQKDYADSESEDNEGDQLISLNDIQSQSVEIQGTVDININSSDNIQSINVSLNVDCSTILSSSQNHNAPKNLEQLQNSNNFDISNLTQNVNEMVNLSDNNNSNPNSIILPASEDAGQNKNNDQSDEIDPNLKLDTCISDRSIKTKDPNILNPPKKLSVIVDKSSLSLPQSTEGLSMVKCANNQDVTNKSIDIDQNKKIFDCINKISAEADNQSSEDHVNKMGNKIVLVEEMHSDESEVESGETSIEESQSYPQSISKPLEMLQTVDLVKPFGITLDPSSTDNYESVETITIDANQKTQDEEEDIEVVSDDSFVSNDSSSSCVEIYEESSTDRLLQEISSNSPCKSDRKKTIASKTIDSKSQYNELIVVPNEKSINSDPNKETQNYLNKLRIFSNLTSDLNEEEKESNAKKVKLEDEEGSKLKCRRYDCRGCDSKFWILRFYYQHISRVTAKITYDCKECKVRMKFTNPCLLKIHIKSHSKSINSVKMSESNLNVELPSMSEFKKKYLLEFQPASIEKTLGTSKEEGDDEDLEDSFICPECHVSTPSLVEHLMYKPYNSNVNFQCSNCEYLFSSKCALLIHERIHTSKRPYCCPECGTSFVTQNRLLAHVSVECYHFRRCLLSKCSDCGVVLPDKTTLKNHMLTKHRSVVYKCSQCPDLFKIVSEFHTHVRDKHNHSSKVDIGNIFDKCDLCSVKGRIFPHSEFGDHLSQHIDDVACVFFGFRCRKCKFLAQNPVLFQNHMESSLVCKMNEDIAFKQSYPSISHPLKKRKCEEYCNPVIQKKFRYIYATHQGVNKEEEVTNSRSNEATSDKTVDFTCIKSDEDTKSSMFCLLCSKQFPGSSEIREHINYYHKCEDYHKYVQVSLDLKENEENESGMRNDDNHTNPSDYENLDSNSDSDESEESRDPLSCPNCEYLATSKDDFRTHVIKHRDDEAFQCLECGECFVRRSSLETHLASVHSIKDTLSYISSHNVHNSFPKADKEKEKQLKPNQCSVCFNVFPDDKALQLHFRCHGMAFLRRNFAKSLST